MIGTWKRAITQRFEEQLLPRYQQLENREQKLVLIATIALPLIIIVFGVMIPLHDRQLTLQKELSIATNQAAKANQLASYLTAHATDLKANNNTESLLSLVDQLARQTNIRTFMTRIKPLTSLNGGSQKLMLSIKNVPYDSMLRFIHALAKRDLGLKQLKFQTAGKPGYVHVQAIVTGS
ncbi:hypothetical protein D8Y20_12100 [Mariprofundus sp. EBB-1]|uniref:type II secretion system protein GspM n=1 Tax=Mariprofundus sp. EBB-1 TaxID=2650971 RepID=UPI000EF1B5C0|nr:type II secretion system protein GspM [Mariprofundus sp. EBB-1]RLL50171.1 hypothetical protein D8Y20_12100 [Mariprofundus sp. EBB-1]